MVDSQREEKRRQLRQRLAKLETELTGLHTELAQLGTGSPLPGLYLLVESAGFTAALPSSLVLEIVRLVETTPLPKAPPHVLGSFVYRGDPVVAVDLARCLGQAERPLDVDAHMVVLATSRPVALVVDRVKALVEAPAVAEAPKDAPTWLSTPLVAALCRAEDELIPVLRTELLLEGLPQ